MNYSQLSSYIGVPVLVQLKNFPLVGVQVRFKDKLAHADRGEADWVPEPLMDHFEVDGKIKAMPSATQLIQFAVLREVSESSAGMIGGESSLIEIQWFSSPPDPRNPQDPIKKATIATLIHLDDILAVTRVISVDEPSTILLA